MRSEDYGKHLLDVENLLHKHSLVESQIQSQGESVQRVNNIAQRFLKAKHPESRVIKERQLLLSQAFEVQCCHTLNMTYTKRNLFCLEVFNGHTMYVQLHFFPLS